MYDEHLADLEEKRRKMIHDARLMMIYQISSVDQEFDMNNKLVQEECLAERRELQNAMFTVIEEKRKKLKEDKDGEGELGLSTHHTRNKQRLLRKRGEILDGYLTAQQQSLSSPVISQKRKQDHILFTVHVRCILLTSLKLYTFNSFFLRAKESPSHLIGVLSHRVEEDIEADFHAMTSKRKKP
ncbi:hypothetical protein FB192DRAFT_1351041 [Mucor lusitanicus]|uniref:Uncharacterized protein n=1 Tax=Mucor circinelloides f. lusitanicus TaxID=29924 RepID=A0A8H4F557_MUCCL|nr:hypothetical protein FB192DRAFT_1351041 [Mucor lusitanicus]